MKKELLFSVFIGLTLGLLLTYLIYRSRSVSQVAQQEMTLQENTSPEPSASVLSNLVVNSPENESIVSDPDVTIAGTTTANVFVVIFINDKEIITTADTSGNFSVKGQLENGSNVITIHALEENGNATVEERVIIYTSQSLETETASSSATPSTSAKPSTKPSATPN